MENNEFESKILSSEEIGDIDKLLLKQEKLKEIRKETAGEVINEFSGLVKSFEKPCFMMVFFGLELLDARKSEQLSINEIKDENIKIISKGEAMDMARFKEKSKGLILKMLRDSENKYSDKDFSGVCSGGFCSIVGGFEEVKRKIYSEQIVSICGMKVKEKTEMFLNAERADDHGVLVA